MGYDPNRPQPNDRLSVSQQDIFNNFSSANTIFGVDHYEFNNTIVADRGRHKKVGLISHVAGDISTLADEIGIWVKNDNSLPAPRPQIFMRLPNDGAITQITGANVFNINGQAVLPGGILMKWGQLAISDAATRAVVFPTGGDFIAFTATPYSIQVTGLRAASSPGNTDAFVSTGGLSNLGFTIYNNGEHHMGFMWLAIGRF